MEPPSAVIIYGVTCHPKEGKIISRERFVLVDRHGLVAPHLKKLLNENNKLKRKTLITESIMERLTWELG